MLNIFSVDVEEYFHHAPQGVVARREWPALPSRVEPSVDLLLALLAEYHARATFFCLGWVAERHPDMIRRIVAGGHEIGSHGWWHERVTSLTREQFRVEVRSSRVLLEDLSGMPVVGYRAPGFTIVPDSEWALDVLAEEGYLYDSSVFPIHGPGTGWPGAPASPHVLDRAAGPIVELPPATLTILGSHLPAAGGGYLRHFPLALVRSAVRQHARRGEPAMLYVHPWELDPDQPRMPVGRVTGIQHYRGLDITAERLRLLFSEFRFGSAADYYFSHCATDPVIPQGQVEINS